MFRMTFELISLMARLIEYGKSIPKRMHGALLYEHYSNSHVAMIQVEKQVIYLTAK